MASDPPDAPPRDPDFGHWDEVARRREAEEENAEQRHEMEREMYANYRKVHIKVPSVIDRGLLAGAAGVTTDADDIATLTDAKWDKVVDDLHESSTDPHDPLVALSRKLARAVLAADPGGLTPEALAAHQRKIATVAEHPYPVTRRPKKGDSGGC